MKIVDINNSIRECKRVFLDPAWPGYVSVEFVRKSDSQKTRIEWMPLSDFATKNPQLSDLWGTHSTAPAPDTAGVVTMAGKDTLVDSAASWGINAYAGHYVWISRGPGDGSTRIILKNTATILYMDKPWDKKPNKDSQYAIVQRLPQNHEPSGQVLPITELRELEKKARKMDIKAGREPAPRQYTKS
jgi:hypothetical protein